MSKLKTIVLSSGAVLATFATVHAADLPAYKSAPVDYVRICDAFGAGFFYIPGTDTCLRVNGAVRAENTVRSNAPTGNPYANGYNLAGSVYHRDLLAFRARGYLNADARTQTAYGTIRAYVSYRVTLDTTAPGPYGGGSFTPAGATFSQKTSAFQGFPQPGAQAILDKGFIQFAGLTAGRAQSFFDFDAQSHELLTNSIGNSNQTTEMLAYTATLFKGLTATISMEDRNERVIGDDGFYQPNLNPTAVKAGYLAYAGETVPDVVGNLALDQSWGTAQLSGAYHQLSSLAVTLPNGKSVEPSDVDGFAALAGVKVLTPFIAKGDNLTLQGTYERGAMDYLNPLNYQSNGITNIYSHDLSVSIPVNDGFILPGGRIGTNHGYGGYAAYQHYWAPEWNSSLYGDYVQIRNPPAAQLLTAAGDNANIYQIGGNLIWTPVKDLIIGGEVLYTNMHLSGAFNLAATKSGPLLTPTPTDPDDVRGRLSLRRAF